MTILFDLIYVLVVCLGWPFLLIRRWRRGPGSVALGDRLGAVPSRPVSANCIWLHGVSLGEINATRTIVEELRRRAPGTVIAVSATTTTGIDRARKLYPEHIVFRFPLDFSFILRRVFRRIRPSVIVLLELEAWPNLVKVARAEGVPVLIANGRVTEEGSMRRFDRPIIRSIARRMFRQLRWVGAQDATYAERFVRLGVPEERVEVCGSVKYDAADISDRLAGQDELAEEMTIDPSRPLWVCGSTGPDEEAIILDSYAELIHREPLLQLAIIPRKPERFDDVAELICSRGYACLRRSGKPPLVPPSVPEPRAVFLGDTMGELRKFYALSAVVFVGRSLVPMGGSDVMEAAGLAKPVLVGPHTENFSEAVGLLTESGGAQVVSDAATLAEAVVEILQDAIRRRRMSRAARETIVSRRGATRQIVDRILEFAELD